VLFAGLGLEGIHHTRIPGSADLPYGTKPDKRLIAVSLYPDFSAGYWCILSGSSAFSRSGDKLDDVSSFGISVKSR